MAHKSILLVEDDGLIAMRVSEVLSKAGYDVRDPLPTGEEALEELSHPPLPDLILMDIGLTGHIDGIETARKIREVTDVPVLFLSAYSDNRRIHDAIAIRAAGYLIKPFGEKDLLMSIERAVNH